MSPLGGDNKGILGDAIGGVFSPVPGFQPFNPGQQSSMFNAGGVGGSGFNSFYPNFFQFEDDLDDVESRIHEWEDGWGVDPDEDFDQQDSDVFRENGVEAENRLTRIYKTRDNLRKMRTKFAGVEVAANQPMKQAKSSSGSIRLDMLRRDERNNGITTNIDGRQIMRDKNQDWNRNRFPGGRVQELQDDLANSAETLKDLNRQVDDLNRRLPPPLERRITAAGEPPTATDRVASISEDSSDSDRDLKGLSGLRQMVLEVRRMNQTQSMRKQIHFSNPLDEWWPKGNEKWCWSEYRQDGRKINILVEWKHINAANPPPPHNTFTFKNMVRVKIESLTSLLKIPENVRVPGLRMLNCLGVFKRSNDDEVSYGIVFEVPSKRHQTLLDVLQKDAGFVRQSQWMLMAKALAKAVLYLHLARWLHKGIQSSNILLFEREDGTIDYAEPYLVGYEYSRQSGKISLTEKVEDDLVTNLYRHPRMQGLPQDSSSPAGLGSSRDNSPARLERETNGSSPPIGGPPRRESSVPAPLVIRRDRATSNPNAPPLLVRRDSGVGRGHQRQNSSLDRSDLVRRDSDRDSNKSPFQASHDIYALGIVLLEVGLREPIKSVYNRASRDPIYGKHFSEKFRQWILANEVPRLGILVGDKYQEVVTTCLDDSLEGISDQELQKEFYGKVVRVLANITAHL